MIKKIPASVYIICCNEERHLRRTLESVKDFAEKVVVDSGSSDGTLAIAREYTGRIIHQEWLGFSRQKAFALAQCGYEWVLNIDADEEVSPELIQEIEEVISGKRAVDGLDIGIAGVVMGQVSSSWSRLNRRIRFFRKTKGHYQETLVHESISVAGRVEKSRGIIIDYGETSLAVKVAKLNQYSTLRAVEKFENNKKPSMLKLILAFPAAFFKSFILRRSFTNGLSGFVASMSNAYYAFLKEAKLYELDMNPEVMSDYQSTN